MSEALGYEQANVISGSRGTPPAFLGDFGDRAPAGRRLDVSPDELRLRQLTGSWEIAEVAHLRRQIQLPAAVLADPGFAALEKKEIGSAWSRRSSGVTSRSAP